MSDVILKTISPQAPTQTPSEVFNDPKATTKTDAIDVPFNSYHVDNAHPYTVDYFKLGENWKEFDEVPAIEDYLKEQVDNGKLKNSVDAINRKLSEIEHMAGIDYDERDVMKIAKIAAFIKFLKETDSIDLHNTKYGN